MIRSLHAAGDSRRAAGTLISAGVIAVLAAACVLMLANLGQQCLWQDEAQTALIAGTILSHGIPLGHDGRNSFSQEQGRDFGPGYVWLWHPWLSFYVLAGFFAVLGKSTFAARLPFALFGIATAAATYVLAARMWNSQRAGIFAAATLTLNVWFLILCRQCRYYSPSAFFAVLSFIGYAGILEGRKRASALYFTALLLLFHSHYVPWAAVIAATNFHALVFRRDRFGRVVLWSMVSGVLSIPWFLWTGIFGSPAAAYGGLAKDVIGFARVYIGNAGTGVFPPLLIIPGAAAGIILWRRSGRPAFRGAAWPGYLVMIIVYVGASVAILSVTSAFPFFRYTVAIMPVCCALTGLILDSVSRLHKVFGSAAAAIILLLLAWHWQMPDCLYEITHRYVGPVDGMVEFLKINAAPNDVVAVSYEDMPIKFYTNLRVVGGLTGEDLSPALDAEWVVLRKETISPEDTRVRDFLWTRVVMVQDYVPIRLECPNLPFQNREEPQHHLFRTAEFRADDSSSLIIWRRNDEPRF